MNDNYICNAEQGWQCPLCKRVYSPSTPMCWYCGEGGMKKSTTSTTIRWTDKVWLDSQGNLQSMDGCPTDLVFNAGGHLYGVMGGDKIMEEFEKDKKEAKEEGGETNEG